MDQLGIGAVVVGLGLTLALLIWQSRAAGQSRKLARAGYFDACKALFSDGLKAIAPTGFARISGRHAGQTFDLQAVPDTLTFRKLPALWILVTLPVPLPVAATFDLMIRPSGVEPFSNFATLPEQVAAPAGFPADCMIRTDDAERMPDADLLRRHLGLFADPRVKELVISPKGLRLVWLAEEANRGRYLVFRDAEMGLLPLPVAALQPIVAALLALQADILAQSNADERRIA